MMQPFTVRSRAWRILRHLERFRLYGEGGLEEDPDRWRTHVRAGEEIIGLYNNSPASVEDTACILVTDKGLHQFESGNQVQFIGFCGIKKIRGPAEKVGADRLELELEVGKSLVLIVRGGDEKFRDVFTMLHFLQRVSEDCAKQKQAG